MYFLRVSRADGQTGAENCCEWMDEIVNNHDYEQVCELASGRAIPPVCFLFFWLSATEGIENGVPPM